MRAPGPAASGNGWRRRSRRTNPRALRVVALSAVLAAGGIGFASLLEDLVARDSMIYADLSIANLVQSVRNTPADRVMVAITMIGDGTVLTALGAVIVAWLLARKAWDDRGGGRGDDGVRRAVRAVHEAHPAGRPAGRRLRRGGPLHLPVRPRDARDRGLRHPGGADRARRRALGQGGDLRLRPAPSSSRSPVRASISARTGPRTWRAGSCSACR